MWVSLSLLIGLTAAGNTTPARRPLFERVALAPITIEPEPHPKTTGWHAAAEDLQRLGREATARAERTLLQQGIARHVERVSAATPVSLPRVSGVVRLPVALPPEATGAQATFRRGDFAIATVELVLPTTSRTERATLGWRDVRWLRGVRIRRARPLDTVLTDAVRKAVDHAVKRLRDVPRCTAATRSGSVEESL